MKIQEITNIKSLLFQNTTIKQTFFKNTFWLGFSAVFNKILALILLIYVARILGAEEYGKFTFSIAFISLLMIFADFGLSAIITREFSREKENRKEFYSIISLKILLISVSLFLILITSYFTIHDQSIQKIILILMFFFLVNSFVSIFYSFFHALQKMEYEAWPEILQVILLLGIGFFILFNFPSVINLSYAYLISSFIVLLFILIFFNFKIFPLKIKWDFSIWKKFLTMSWPLALIGIFGMIYGYTDSVMMGYWNMISETGWYNAASKITTATLMFMGLIATSFYPLLSKLSKESKDKFQKIWNYELDIMIILAFPLVFGGIVLAPKIINLFYSVDFYPSILAFQILILTSGIIFIYRPFYDAMIVFNQQSKTFWITVAGALINIILNFILIPKYSLYGAAVTTVITNIIVLLAIVFFTRKFTDINFSFSRIFLTSFIAIICSFLMFLGLKKSLNYDINLFFLIIIGSLIYLITFFFTKKYLLNRFNYLYV